MIIRKSRFGYSDCGTFSVHPSGLSDGSRTVKTEYLAEHARAVSLRGNGETVSDFIYRKWGGMTVSAFSGMLDGFGIAQEGTKNVLAWTNPVYAEPQIRTPRTHAPAYTIARDYLASVEPSKAALEEAVKRAKAAKPEADSRIVEHIGFMLQSR